MLGFLGATGDLMLVVLGFSFIVLVHELGHFLAARWAKVRVEAFAMGFGPAVCSFRKGMGARWGSTEPEYRRMRVENPAKAAALSPTEYRLNWLFFGGYVRMLGQDDASPGARVEHPDSFTSKPVWKRMVIISAGVIMNVLLAAVLFVVVFMIGLRTEPPLVGLVSPKSAAASAEVVSGWDEADPGLKPGDRVLLIAGHEPRDFGDIALEVAMARRGAPVEIVVEREGASGPVVLRASPAESRATRLLEIGIVPALSTRLFGGPDDLPANNAVIAEELREAGLGEVPAGSTLLEVAGRPAQSARDLSDAVARSQGAPVLLTWGAPGGETLATELRPRAGLQAATTTLPRFRGADARDIDVQHLLGLMPAMRVERAGQAEQKGLRTGDVFARIGGFEWPDMVSGIAEVRRHAGREIDLRLLRDGGFVDVRARVARDGTIGFIPGTTASTGAVVAGTLRRAVPGDQADVAPAIPPGAVILSADGAPLRSLESLRAAIAAAPRTADGAASVQLALRLPIGGWGEGPIETIDWAIPGAAVDALAAAGWNSPLSLSAFRMAET
ncbi:MAG: site-2 protease family protein, partial [Phycisphaerales bacterium]|nr:site-2 protease family protein [Phycisphaerales bacterium]